ncbi:pseudouridine-5'-phosphate glycosidase [Amphibiibacter pelophylacis]|uniref:pseudouridine-5'-phosphate glycosidase n=1 Tax=Amphibiibacter pelophylacis TaxID=1799477 RepID=UPI003BFA6F92
MAERLQIQPEVREALHSGRPVVALESTIISHGMPYPQNVETALQVEAAVRDQGAVPATMAIQEGRLCIGLSTAQIDTLGRAGHAATKVSRRDLASVLSQGGLGATTVASTMMLAAWAGIRIFATGGIGGVHRGGERSMDISADLQELARTPVAVVCAGAKSILDLGLTLEYLETHGVPVVGYQTDELPAFFSRESGHAVPLRRDSPGSLAQLLHTHWGLGLSSGCVVAHPIAPEHALDADQIDDTIARALDEAERQGIHGKAVTPFLLARVNELSGGRSLASNIQLVLGNARLAAQTAVSLSALSALNAPGAA